MEHTLDILLVATLVAWVLAYLNRTRVALNWMIKLVALTFLVLTFQIFANTYPLYRTLLDVALLLSLVWGLMHMVKASSRSRIIKSK